MSNAGRRDASPVECSGTSPRAPRPRGSLVTKRQMPRGVCGWVSHVVLVFVLSAALGTVATAQTDTVAAGGRIYRQKADCQACHGWAGDGRKMNNQMPDGANLRESVLDREQLLFVIKCGLPGRSMPAFDRRAYSDDRCLGRTRADLERLGLELPDPGATLQPREMERLADFLMAKVIGLGPMNRAACVDYWGEEVEVCAELPD